MARWLLVCLIALAMSNDSVAQPSGPVTAGTWQSLQEQVAATIDKAAPSVVAIERYRAPQLGENPLGQSPLGAAPPVTTFRNAAGLNAVAPYASGAGIVIDASGLVLTQYLNIRVGDQHRVVTSTGKTFDATIKAADPRSGLAVLELAGASDLTPLPLSTAQTVRKGTFVIAIGNPQAIAAQGTASASMGMVSNVGQKAPLGTNFANNVDSTAGLSAAGSLHQLGTLIETDAALGWSAGGGALVDLDGNLVGVITDAVTLPGYELPAHYAIPVGGAFTGIIDRLRRGEEIEYALLGIALADVRTLLAPENGGATVLSTYPGTPAARAGLQPGDIIATVDGQTLNSPQDLQLKVGLMPPGKTVQVEFIRSSKRDTTQMTLGKYYISGEKVVTAQQPEWRGMRVDYATALPTNQLIQNTSMGVIDPEGCVLVSAVRPDSTSWGSGVRPGMFVSHIGETRVSSPAEFYEVAKSADETVDLRFTEANEPTDEMPLIPR